MVFEQRLGGGEGREWTDVQKAHTSFHVQTKCPITACYCLIQIYRD